ncbi:MAG: N-acetylmuramoyl-L-alanine amidase [Longimicrobiaceae bacterium]
MYRYRSSFSEAPRIVGASAAALGAALLGACAPMAPTPAPAPAPWQDAEPDPRLPPIPARDGELALEVVYPPEGAGVTASDSNFIFGSVGTGRASLTINGAGVEVAPNGGWLAFLPVPADGVYRLVAVREGQTVRTTRTVEVPAGAGPALPAGAHIAQGSASPTGSYTGVAGEVVEISFRGTPGGRGFLVLPDGGRVSLAEQAAVDVTSGFMVDRTERRASLSEYAGSLRLEEGFTSPDTAVAAPTLRPGTLHQTGARDTVSGARVELVVGADTARAPLPLSLFVLEPGQPRIGVAASERVDDTVIGRKLPSAGNPYQWFFPNGTRFEVSGETDWFYRVRLSDDLSAWVLKHEVELLPAGTPAGRIDVRSIVLEAEPEYTELRLTTTERAPFRVELTPDGVRVDLYNTVGRANLTRYGPDDGFIERVTWDQVGDDLFRVILELDRPLWGHTAFFDQNGYLRVRLRRPPGIDPGAPLRGLTVAVDAGHGGEETGAAGPTGLLEKDANRWIADRLIPMLEQAGARVVEIRPGDETVPLIERPLKATESGAHLFVSVHNNAFPDGVNPWRENGTSVLYNRPYSLGLARHLQREIVAGFGLRNLGVFRGDYALPRTSWMPSVITESFFMMIPEQEAALRDPGVQERLARAHLRGIESFLRASAGVDQ